MGNTIGGSNFRSAANAVVRELPSSKLKYAFEQSAAVKHVLRLHLGTELLQLQNVAACNAVHPVECPDGSVVARTARSGCRRRNSADAGDACTAVGVRRTTVTLTMTKLRLAGCIKPDRRGLLNIERTQPEDIACECYGVMRGRIDRRAIMRSGWKTGKFQLGRVKGRRLEACKLALPARRVMSVPVQT